MGTELHNKFIELRAKGFSLSQVARKIGKAVDTICNWEKKYIAKIEELKAIELDGLYQRFYMQKAAKITALGTILEKLLIEASKRKVAELKTGEILYYILQYFKSLEDEKPIKTISYDVTTKSDENHKLSFLEFCEKAGYPKPFEKQIEMKDFIFNNKGARMLLGARGIGKSDMCTIMGTAHEIYLKRELRVLIVTKSKERNSAILSEISKALMCFGITFEINNCTCIRLTGLQGKDNSVSAVTVGTNSLRGRHPDIILCDDIITIEDNGEAVRNRVQRVFDELTKLTSEVAIIGQPAHFNDLYAKLRPVLTNKLEIPWGQIPELDHDIEAARQAGVSEESIQASYFLRIANLGSQPFEKIKYIDKFPKEGPAVAWIDPSFEGSDHSALCILKAYFDGVAAVIFSWKKPWNNCIDDIIPKLIKYGVTRLAIETNCLGSLPIDLLIKVVPKNVGVVGRKTVINKQQKILNAATFSHLIHLCKESDKFCIDNIVNWDYNAKIDDPVDSLASCLLWLGLIRGNK